MKTIIFIIASAFILISLSCKKENTSPSSNTVPNGFTTDLSGFGNRGGMPSGNSFDLPANVKMTPGWDSNWTSQQFYGVGDIGSRFTLSNLNSVPITFNIPAGLIFLPNNQIITQSGLSIVPISVSLAAKE